MLQKGTPLQQPGKILRHLVPAHLPRPVHYNQPPWWQRHHQTRAQCSCLEAQRVARFCTYIAVQIKVGKSISGAFDQEPVNEHLDTVV